MLLYTFFALNVVICTCKKVQNKRIRKIGQYIAKLSHFKVSKNTKIKQRYGVATVQIVYATAYEWYKFSLLSELDIYFQ